MTILYIRTILTIRGINIIGIGSRSRISSRDIFIRSVHGSSIIRTLLTVENHILSYPLPNNINFNYNKGFILSNIII